MIRKLQTDNNAPSFVKIHLYPVKSTITDIKIPGEKFDCNKTYKQKKQMGLSTIGLF